jgi:S1-C subfamily serine protease
LLLEKKIIFVLTVLIAIGSTAFIYTQFNGDNDDDDSFSLIDKISSLLVRNSLFYPDSTITKDAFKIGQVGALMASSQPDLTLPDLYTRVEKSVVQITGRAASNTDLLSRGNARLGSGFVYDDNGHIITNNHVVAGSEGGKEEEDFDVTFLDGTIYRAKLIGADPSTDLTVLYVEDVPRDKLVPLPLSNSSRLRVGEQVAAIGNPFGLSGSMTEGVISGLGRLISLDPRLSTQAQYSIPDVIQTDAAINPGNSGGPLLNMRGEVIGINSVIFSSTGSFAGVGFAIPSNTINKITPSLITKGSFAHPWLGISGSDMTPYIAAAIGLEEEPRGFLVMDVVAGSPADKAGIQGGNKITNIDRREITLGGDVILEIDNKIVRKIDDILTYLEREKTVGDSVKLTVLRDGNIQEINVRLGERPNSQQSP